MHRLTKMEEIEDARRTLAEVLDACGLWFCAERRGGASVELRRGEWELRASPGFLLFSFWGESGSRAWRVVAWERSGEKILLEATRRMGAERTTLELIPRASAAATRAIVFAARRAACERLAALASGTRRGAKVERARLSAGARRGEPGRYARIILRRGRETLAATGPVADVGAPDANAFLTSALLWFARLKDKARADTPRGLLLIAPGKLCEATAERLALLRREMRNAISLYESDEEATCLSPLRAPELSELLASPTPRLFHPTRSVTSELAERIRALAPEAIDIVRARHGETLRFHGLAFARVRRVSEREHLWFGIRAAAPKKRLLKETDWPVLSKLIADLAAYRRADADDRAHAMYSSAPEAWLESILRRDITRLDPGLIISPLHAQFRASHGATGGARPVDLLALRRDGRLVVIELKVSEDAEHALQCADYWRRVEAHRRRGNIARVRLFGDAQIAEEPPLVYAVAPLLRFHRAFSTLAQAITPGIEIYRFDINEDWRGGVRVMRRERVV